jgi:hypothetical protein
MTTWRPLKLDPVAARTQLEALRDRLNFNPRMEEGSVRDFISANPQIVALGWLRNGGKAILHQWLSLLRADADSR